MLRLFTAYLAAVLSTAILCSILSTQFVIAGLQSIDVAIPLSVRLQMTMQDFGILQTLLPAIAACFAGGLGGWLFARLSAKQTEEIQNA